MTLSIITINYNNREGLQKTIESVVSQTWTDYEWIVIDGGSTDGSRELIERYQEYFAYWCSEHDRGVYHAMNKGVSKAKGEYLNFMNSGDCFYEAETLKEVFTQERKADILYGDWMENYSDKEVKRSIPQGELFNTLWYQNICHQAMFIKTTILKQKGYDESMKMLADWYRNTEMALAGIVFKHLPIIICRYDMYGISNRIDDSVIQEEIALIRHLYPKPLLYALQELHRYEENKYVQQTLSLTQGNHIGTKITKGILTMLGFLFHIFQKKYST